MLLATARRRVAAWRQSRLSARLACALWIAWAVIIWNVVFDHAIVVARRGARGGRPGRTIRQHGRVDASGRLARLLDGHGGRRRRAVVRPHRHQQVGTLGRPASVPGHPEQLEG
jgi:hypothetical protein